MVRFKQSTDRSIRQYACVTLTMEQTGSWPNTRRATFSYLPCTGSRTYVLWSKAVISAGWLLYQLSWLDPSDRLATWSIDLITVGLTIISHSLVLMWTTASLEWITWRRNDAIHREMERELHRYFISLFVGGQKFDDCIDAMFVTE
jgi:hypothetical protein